MWSSWLLIVCGLMSTYERWRGDGAELVSDASIHRRGFWNDGFVIPAIWESSDGLGQLGQSIC